ncbi:protein trichome birefringence-like 16 isoform X2 [Mercurialis annua]|uniref:protein trichome birefringence-like 16 isoform X2 n=1 Tax=Mercurialis annua TaxID=3986 RepID=UPI00215EE27F|nr:protein trichome birefringence-like 16 isoform X2 [Mercurialis annua]
MKGGGGFSRIWGKEFSLLLIVLIGAIILLWAWDRTPFLATLLPPKPQLQLQIFQEPNLHTSKGLDATNQTPVSSNSSRSPVQEEEDTETKGHQVVEGGKNGSVESFIVTETKGKHSDYEAEHISKGKEQALDFTETESSANASSSVTNPEVQDYKVEESEENSSAKNSTKSEADENHNKIRGDEDLKENYQPGAPLDSAYTSPLQRGQAKKNFTTVAETEQEHISEGKEQVLDFTATESSANASSSVTNPEVQDNKVEESEENSSAKNSTKSEADEKHQKIRGDKDVKENYQLGGSIDSANTSFLQGGQAKNFTTIVVTEQEHISKGKDQALDFTATESSANASSSVTNTEVQDSKVEELEENSSANNSTKSKGDEKHSKVRGDEDVKENYQLGAPIDSANTSFLQGGQAKKNFTTIVVTEQACNYAKGKWVVDDSRPLYSGFDCKQWLAPMWACRLMQRTDFSYEKLRWQPKSCEMESFEGTKFLKRMQGRTLAFVGDSLGRQQFQSFMCMITGGKESPDVHDVGIEYGLAKPQGGVRPNGWAYRFPTTNTTVLYYWSACLCDLEPINIKNPVTDYAMHLDRPPSFLRQFLKKIDVLVLNTGHHWNRGKIKANRWVMHVGGKPNTNKKLAMIGDAKNFTIHSIIDWVNKQLPKNPQLKAFYRSISPRHFVNGDWNTGGSCDNTTPMSIGKEVLQDESSDYSAGRAVKGTGVKLLDVTALSQLRDEGHISSYSITATPGVQDCLHWCLPGVPDTWNEILFAQINSPEVQNE